MPGKESLKQKIIMITHEFYPKLRGISVYLQEIAKCASERGNTIEVWAPANDEILAADLPYTVKLMPLKGTQSWVSRIKLALELIKCREQVGNAILYLAEPGPIRTMLYLQLFSVIKPQALWITLYGSEIKKFTIFPHRKILFKKLLKFADRISVISQYNYRILRQLFPELDEKIVVAGCALKSDFTKEVSPKQKNNKDKIIVLTVGGIHPRKGQLNLLHALNRLELDLKKKIEYRLVGPLVKPSYFKKIESYANKNRLNFKYLGEVENKDLSAIYAEADIYAMTSIDYRSSVEGFGLTYLEASAHRLPIIAHRVGGVEDAVKNNVTGILIEPGDYEHLANVLQTLVADSSLRDRLGGEGERWARNHTWEKCVEKIFG